jgi:acetoin utilization protein AcuB
MNKSKVIPRLKTVMTPFPFTIDSGDSIDDAVALMRREKIRHLPVLSGGKLTGIVTERDVKVAAALEEKHPDASVLVGDICHEEPYCADLSRPLNDVVKEMARRHLGSVLVTKNDSLVGIFTTTDACQCLGEFFDTFLPGDIEPDIA